MCFWLEIFNTNCIFIIYISADPNETLDISDQKPAIYNLLWSLFVRLQQEEVTPVIEFPINPRPESNPVLSPDNAISPGWCNGHVQPN